MKRFLLLSITALSFNAAFSQNVGIGTPSPNASAALDLTSTSKGLLVPRMTSAQRTAIASPATGLMVYDISTNSFWYYNGSAWTSVGGAGSLTLPFDASVNINGNAFRIANTSATGIAIVGETDSNVGIFAKSNGTGTAFTALSNTGIAIDALSNTNTVIQAVNNSANPAISVSNVNFGGVAIEANAPNSTAILGVSGGTSKSGIRGEATGNSGIGVFGTTTSATGYGVFATTGTGTALYGTSTSGTGVRAISSTGLALDVSGNIKISGGNTSPSAGAILTSDAQGNATWKNNRIAFLAKGINPDHTTIVATSFVKLHWSGENYDYGNDYFLHVGTNPTSVASTFTVPVSGVYHFDTQATLVRASDDDLYDAKISITLLRNGVTTTIASGTGAIDPSRYMATCRVSCDTKLIAGDVIWVTLYQDNDADGAGTILTGASSSYFSGHLVFAD